MLMTTECAVKQKRISSTFRHYATQLCGIMSREVFMATNPNISEYIGVTPKSEFDLAEIVENGLPTANLNLLRDKGLTFSEASEIVIAPRPLNHHKPNGHHLPPQHTDHLIRVTLVA